MSSDQLFAALHSHLIKLGPRVTGFNLDSFLAQCVLISGAETEQLSRLGIKITGSTDCTIAVESADTTIGNVSITNRGREGLFLFANNRSPSRANIALRVNGSNCIAAFPGCAGTPLSIRDCLFRSDNQILYWGIGATSVGTNLEIEGVGRSVSVGDDCMASSNVWIRNHDMHTVFDVETRTVLNGKACDIVIEEHVWLGFDAFVLSAENIGFGSVLGARALVNRSIPPESLAVGIPARVIKNGIGWARPPGNVPERVTERLTQLRGA
jgi:hypothetical protein